MKNLILIISVIALISCSDESSNAQIETSTKAINSETQFMNIFPPQGSEISKLTVSQNWKEIYDYYLNNIETFKDEPYYEYSKGLLIWKVLNNEQFKKHPNQTEFIYMTKDVFNSKLMNANLILDIIEHYEKHEFEKDEFNLPQLISKNQTYIENIIKNLEIVRNDEKRKSNSPINLESFGFEEKILAFIE